LALEVVQTQVWVDLDQNVRANVTLHNPYDFPVQPGYRGTATLVDAAGARVLDGRLLFLDGISPNGFLRPGETLAATVCFNCEAAPVTAPWSGVTFGLAVKDATGAWKYVDAVEATLAGIAFAGDSPTFWVNGTVTNHSAAPVQRISVRVIVYDEAGQLTGAAETSVEAVAAGATASFAGYGIGQTPAGGYTYDLTALGVNY
jgi:hypothetical protein